MIEYIADHQAQGVARLIERYRKPRISALLGSWLGEVQAVEDALWQLLSARSAGNAEGAQLDVLGRIVGQPREGREDARYRIWVLARVLVSRSSGKTTQLIAIAKKLTSGARVRLEEHYPASLVLHLDDGIDADIGAQIAKLLGAAKAAGVRLQLEWFSVTAGLPFAFAPSTTTVLSSPQGFEAGSLAAVSEGGDVIFEGGTGVPLEALLFDSGGELLYDGDGAYLTLG